jgi:hypothetical protein
MTDKISTSNIATLSELLTLSGSQYRIYDMGRLITKLPKEQFEQVELNQLPYPNPSQGHAFIAITFWQKKNRSTIFMVIEITS